jgi:hypothetical protein
MREIKGGNQLGDFANNLESISWLLVPKTALTPMKSADEGSSGDSVHIQYRRRSRKGQS